MKRRFLKNLTSGLAVLSLVACLAAPVLFFLGRISEKSYKAAFLIASIGWFVFAIARGMVGKDAAAGRTTTA
jgi:hypothetical protein